MRRFRFMKVSDTVIVEAGSRKVAEKRARVVLGDDYSVLISCPENFTVKIHEPKKETK